MKARGGKYYPRALFLVKGLVIGTYTMRLMRQYGVDRASLYTVRARVRRTYHINTVMI